jgi:hypothetical protein
MAQQGNRVLSQDDSCYWILWDTSARAPLASVTNVCALSPPLTSPPQYGLLEMRGGVAAIQSSTGVELHSLNDGSLLGTIATTGSVSPLTQAGLRGQPGSHGRTAWLRATRSGSTGCLSEKWSR